jgi:hypothetical protein
MLDRTAHPVSRRPISFHAERPAFLSVFGICLRSWKTGPLLLVLFFYPAIRGYPQALDRAQGSLGPVKQSVDQPAPLPVTGPCAPSLMRTAALDPLRSVDLEGTPNTPPSKPDAVTVNKEDTPVVLGTLGSASSTKKTVEQSGSTPTKIVIHATNGCSDLTRYHPVPVVIQGEIAPETRAAELPVTVDIRRSSFIGRQAAPVLPGSELPRFQ